MAKKNGIILFDKEEANISRIAIRIPAFWPEDPELWFAQLESQFTLGNITVDDTTYGYVLSKLESKQAREIKDVITYSPTSKYAATKSALVQRLTNSQKQRINQLLEREEIGDRKPSQLLRHLSTLAETSVSNKLLRTLWPITSANPGNPGN